MSLRINAEAPDFDAETTQGTIHFHEWIGDGWAILFSTQKTLPPCALLSSGTWPGCNPNSLSAIPKSLA